MKQINKWIYGLTVMATTMIVSACSQGGSTYSILPAAQSFTQSASSTVNSKMDILWVIDNSSSMDPLQANLTTNFNSFISGFQSNGYDFHMAVTTTDTYLSEANFNNNPSLAEFRDGVGSTHTGIFDILSSTLNLQSVFVTNASQGGGGSGDERAFSSMRDALNSSLNAGFLRSDSYFAIIILSDEDDFSDPNRVEDSWEYSQKSSYYMPDHDYSNPGLDTVDSYVSYLDTLTGTTGATRRYSVSAIAVLDSTCLASHISASPSSVIGQRYIDIAGETSGVTGSICDASYASSLVNIQNNILELGTQFYLNRPPVVSSIVVVVNGVTIPQDPTNGWTYNSTANSIVFHGTDVPPAGATLSINFEPSTLTL